MKFSMLSSSLLLLLASFSGCQCGLGFVRTDPNVDNDGDGFTENEGDCDDFLFDVNPFAIDLCDGLDNNCNGQIDEGGICSCTNGVDQDFDGYSTCDADCNDFDFTIHPFEPESCDGIDNNCNGLTDEGDVCGCIDNDFDGYTSCDGDCDDFNSLVYPGAFDICDGADGDCDGLIDEDGDPSLQQDQDGDGASICNGDCDDNDAARFPGNTESCDGVDNDCDSGVDEDFADLDFDGVSSCAGDCDDNDPTKSPSQPEGCDSIDNNCDGVVDEGFDNDSDGVSVCAGDCNDNNAQISPTGTEVQDGLDNDCDGVVDQPFIDQDGDGVTAAEGDCDDSTSTVSPGAAEVCDLSDNDCDGIVDESFDIDNDSVTSCGGDCNDVNPTIFPGQLEKLDGIDNDCDGQIDEIFFDNDGDGLSEVQGDCDDTNNSVRPNLPEVCDNQDNDCDNLIDEGFDNDGDGVSICGGDCNDQRANVAPGKPELQDGLDNDCDGQIDEDFIDHDGDGSTVQEGDCDDDEPLANPDAIEVAGDNADNDCDGFVDEPILPCDGAVLSNSNPNDYAKAIGLCHGEVTSAQFGGFSSARSIVTAFGSANGPLNDPLEGARMIHLSTGNANTSPHDPGTAHGNSVCTTPHPAPQNAAPGGCAVTDPPDVCDLTEVRFSIKVPSNANSFSFRFQFFSSEYPTFRCSSFDDTFMALLDSASFSGNVSFDNSNNVVSVNNGFFDICIDDTVNVNGGPPNDCTIESGSALNSTGYLFQNNGTNGAGSIGAGATVPLVTTAPVTPGETITLRFVVFDEGDGILDSSVLIDNFTWSLTPISTPVTEPI